MTQEKYINERMITIEQINYYQFFNLPVDADAKTIQKQYREKMKEFHPNNVTIQDETDFPGTTKRFNSRTIIYNNIYEVLSHPEKRKAYDDENENSNLTWQQLYDSHRQYENEQAELGKTTKVFPLISADGEISYYAISVQNDNDRPQISLPLADSSDKKVSGLGISSMDSLQQNQTLEELKNDLDEAGYIILGHGTGSLENPKPIFQNGLRTKMNSLYYTTIGLNTEDIVKLQSQLNNWPHRDSENIILIKLPIQFINTIGDLGDSDGERYGAFFNEHTHEKTGKITYYLSPKYILGCYSSKNEQVKMNPNFESQLTSESFKEMLEKYINTLIKTQERFKREEETFAQGMSTKSSNDTNFTDELFEIDVSSATLPDEEYEWEDPKPKTM
jgi:DnaJ-class molecular chaperone with C-terminal Zn finger domain